MKATGAPTRLLLEMNVTKEFMNEKLKKIIYFFTCILPNYVPHEITKEF